MFDGGGVAPYSVTPAVKMERKWENKRIFLDKLDVFLDKKMFHILKTRAADCENASFDVDKLNRAFENVPVTNKELILHELLYLYMLSTR